VFQRHSPREVVTVGAAAAAGTAGQRKAQCQQQPGDGVYGAHSGALDALAAANKKRF